MNNLESLQKTIQKMNDDKVMFDNNDLMTVYLESIAISLAVIADKMTEESEEEE